MYWKNCAGIKKARICAIYYKYIVTYCVRIAKVSCQNFNPIFINEAFKNSKKKYKRDRFFLLLFGD